MAENCKENTNTYVIKRIKTRKNFNFFLLFFFILSFQWLNPRPPGVWFPYQILFIFYPFFIAWMMGTTPPLHPYHPYQFLFVIFFFSLDRDSISSLFLIDSRIRDFRL